MSNTAGKGPKDNRNPDYQKRRDTWDRVFGKKKKEQTKKEPTIKANDTNGSP